jgi:hypothetical protein
MHAKAVRGVVRRRLARAGMYRPIAKPYACPRDFETADAQCVSDIVSRQTSPVTRSNKYANAGTGSIRSSLSAVETFICLRPQPHVMLGREQEAFHHYGEFLRLVPDHPNRANIRARIGNLRGAPSVPTETSAAP